MRIASEQAAQAMMATGQHLSAPFFKTVIKVVDCLGGRVCALWSNNASLPAARAADATRDAVDYFARVVKFMCVNAGLLENCSGLSRW